jgi:hypothetical protein
MRWAPANGVKDSADRIVFQGAVTRALLAELLMLQPVWCWTTLR